MSHITGKQLSPIPVIILLLIINTAVLLFHLAILFKFIPYGITWGGRLKTDNEMYVFETVSIVINLFFSLVLLMKGRMIKAVISMRAVNVILWVFFAIYALNTVGNLFAATDFEKWFTVLTLLYALLIVFILLRFRNGINDERQL